MNDDASERQKEIQYLYDFVAQQIRAGLYKSDIVEKLIEMGVDKISADALVEEMAERLKRLSRRTVMLVMPDVRQRAVLADGLEAAGYRVFSAAGGEEGLVTVRVAMPDLIVLAVRGAAGEGLRFVKTLRRRPVGRRIPVLVLGARRQQSEAFAAYGKVECLASPVRTDALVERIKKIVYYRQV